MIAQTVQAASPEHGWFLKGGILIFALAMLIWDSVEVGRNDGANLVNAVYGARLMTRQRAVRVAGIATIIGALLSSGVIETARKGIFAPSVLEPEEAAAIYVSVYVVDTILLYGYSAFGMPVSTTASLVFALLGGSQAIAIIRRYQDPVVHWGKASTVVSAIIVSIFLAGFASFFIQRLVRGAIGNRVGELRRMRVEGSWIAGGMATGLVYFLILKGAKEAWGVRHLRLVIDHFDGWLKGAIWAEPTSLSGVAGDFNFGLIIVLFTMWIVFGIAIGILVRIYRERASLRVFPALAVLGMICMAVAFGQNDLANCASPGLATIPIVFNWSKGTAAATQRPIPWWMLLACGVLIFLGMRTRNAARVTKSQVNMGSQSDRVNLYAPRWCIAVASLITSRRPPDVSLAPESQYNPRHKRQHYDALRASTIMCVSASVIALASSYGLPVSTTYVTVAAVVGSGMGDKIYVRGDAALKLARSIWVVFSWFAAAVIATVFTGFVCAVVYWSIALGLGMTGLVVMVALNLLTRQVLSKRGDAQAKRSRQEMLERSHPELFAEMEE